MSFHEEFDLPPLPRHMMVLQQRDSSCRPGLHLIEAICFRRRPTDEDLAILEAWRWKAVA